MESMVNNHGESVIADIANYTMDHYQGEIYKYYNNTKKMIV